MENKIIQEEITKSYVSMLSLLFYNTCKCLIKKEDTEEHKLNPKFHRKRCPYRVKVEKAKLEFKEDE
jgi:hypothetical protein